MSKVKSYYRIITEALPQRVYFVNYFILFLAMLFISASFIGSFLYFKMLETKNSRGEILENFNYWKEVSEAYPNSPDALFETGYYALRLGDKQTAGLYLDKAVKLDPEFEKAEALLQQLTKTTN